MSKITSVGFVAYTLMAPFSPAGTIAAFDLIRPSEFNVATSGWFCPEGHSVKYPRDRREPPRRSANTRWLCSEFHRRYWE